MRKLSARDQLDSIDDLGGSSSEFGGWMGGTLLSLLPCRRGGGAAGLRDWVLVCDPERLRVVGGGVGDLGWVCSSANPSGTLPAASRSKGDSTSSSAEARTGGAGKGLFTFVVPCGERSDVAESELALRGAGPNGEERAGGEMESAPNSILISLPCLELGGGGFLRAKADGTVAKGEDGKTPLRSSTTSDSDIS